MDELNAPLIVPALERATHAVALWIDRSFSDLRLTQAEAQVLAYLALRAPCSINDVHRSFGHRRSTLTSLLDRLEGRGWTRRERHPTSRRLVVVQLTDAGRQAADHVSATLRALEERVRARAGDAGAASFLRVIQLLEEELSREPAER